MFENMTTFFSKVRIKTRIELRNWRYSRKLRRIFQQNLDPNIPAHKMFGATHDDFWLWLYTEGVRRNDAARRFLPDMPEEHIQLQFTGASGNETLQQASAMYTLIKDIVTRYGKDVKHFDHILDFGCGWGRIIRFFLKDVAPACLYGVDCDAEMITLCQHSRIKADFTTVPPFPPMDYADQMFDLIYAYSVFSHLSEEAHLSWIQEFQRILKPEGLLIVTTRPRRFIEHCAALREMKDIPFFATGAAASFTEKEESLNAYDEGHFCFSPSGGGGVRESSFYGEACIPKQYAERVWTQHFRRIDYLDCDDHQRFDQNVIIAQK